MSNDLQNTNGTEFNGNVEDILESLQKSFSRLSCRSASAIGDNAAALITGPVGFSIKLRVSPNRDYLQVTPDGSIELSLEGKVDLDVRVHTKKPTV